MKRYIMVLVILIVSATTALSCQFDTDCGVGSICLKNKGSLYGVCFSGNQSRGRGIDTSMYPIYTPQPPPRLKDASELMSDMNKMQKDRLELQEQAYRNRLLQLQIQNMEQEQANKRMR